MSDTNKYFVLCVTGAKQNFGFTLHINFRYKFGRLFEKLIVNEKCLLFQESRRKLGCRGQSGARGKGYDSSGTQLLQLPEVISPYNAPCIRL